MQADCNKTITYNTYNFCMTQLAITTFGRKQRHLYNKHFIRLTSYYKPEAIGLAGDKTCLILTFVTIWL